MVIAVMTYISDLQQWFASSEILWKIAVIKSLIGLKTPLNVHAEVA
jgi:hypothetical protein